MFVHISDLLQFSFSHRKRSKIINQDRCARWTLLMDLNRNVSIRIMAAKINVYFILYVEP